MLTFRLRTFWTPSWWITVLLNVIVRSEVRSNARCNTVVIMVTVNALPASTELYSDVVSVILHSNWEMLRIFGGDFLSVFLPKTQISPREETEKFMAYAHLLTRAWACVPVCVGRGDLSGHRCTEACGSEPVSVLSTPAWSEMRVDVEVSATAHCSQCRLITSLFILMDSVLFSPHSFSASI